MTRSIRRFLLFNLLLSIAVTSSITAVGNYFLDNSDIQRQLDTHLQQTALFLNAVLTESNYSGWKFQRLQRVINTSNRKSKTIVKPTNQTIDIGHVQQDHFEFQVWDQKGEIVLHSKKSPKMHFPNESGFSILTQKGRTWRIYTLYNPKLKLQISAAEPNELRAQLEERITWDNLLIILWTYPLLGLLIWLTVGSGLKSLDLLAKKLARRKEADFSPLKIKDIPVEIQGLVNELNLLFTRLKQAFDRNKRFASDAAHELRTPLAALKTQTQLALLAENEQERQDALQKLLDSVDRATHVVQQLLTLSRLGAEDSLDNIMPLELTSATAEVLAEIAPSALEKDIDIELLEPDTKAVIQGNKTALSVLIRNLVDNAIRYTPQHGMIRVRVFAENAQHEVILRVIDNGPGISPELRTRVFERFYRVLGTTASGSGLGLAISQQIADLHNARIELGTPENGKGLQVDVIFQNA